MDYPQRSDYSKDSLYYLGMAEWYEKNYSSWDSMISHCLSMAANWEAWENRHSAMWDS